MFSNPIRSIKSPAYFVDFFSLTIVLLLSIITLVPLISFPISLPDRIGRLNDYGNVLTMKDQRELKEKIDELKEKEIRLNLLVSTRDPYLNPDIYASKIRAKWGIRESQKENFILFVREEDGWAVRTFFTATLLNLFSGDKLTNYQDTLKKMTRNGEIRAGINHAVDAIHKQAYPPKKKPDQPTEDADGLPLLYIIIGGIAGGVLISIILLRWEAMRRCPQCGSRLHISRIRSEFGNETVKSCPECGYSETV